MGADAACAGQQWVKEGDVSRHVSTHGVAPAWFCNAALIRAITSLVLSHANTACR